MPSPYPKTLMNLALEEANLMRIEDDLSDAYTMLHESSFALIEVQQKAWAAPLLRCEAEVKATLALVSRRLAFLRAVVDNES